MVWGHKGMEWRHIVWYGDTKVWNGGTQYGTGWNGGTQYDTSTGNT